MADPLDYTLVRIDNNIKDKAVLTYDALNDKITDSGLRASRGELQAAAGTVSVGVQNIESLGDEVGFLNTYDSQAYAFPWYYLSENLPNITYTREFGTLQTVTRFATRTDELVNPMFDVTIPTSESIFRVNVTFAAAHPSVEFQISSAGAEMWRLVTDVSAGKQDIMLHAPIALGAGTYAFSIKPSSDDTSGLPVRVMGDAQTGEVGYDVVFRSFTEKPLATQEYVLDTVSGGHADDVMLKSVYDKQNDGEVDKTHAADKITGVSVAGNFKYYGTNSAGKAGFYDLPAGADEDALKADIKANSDAIKVNTDEIAKHETAIEGHGTQLATHAKSIDTNTKDLVQLRGEVSSNGGELGVLRKNAVDQITATVDNTHKIITLALIAKGSHVDSVAIDLGSWFDDTPKPPVTDYKIYFGFSANPPLTEEEILRLGTAKTVPSIKGLDIVMTRSSQVSSNMWVWLPDGAGTIKGFTFSGFLSVWGSEAISVAGTPGKFYTSPQKTSATNVSFEVTV